MSRNCEWFAGGTENAFEDKEYLVKGFGNSSHIILPINSEGKRIVTGVRKK